MSEQKQRTAQPENKVRTVLVTAGTWLWRLRKIFLALPIIYGAVYLARLNWNTLPDTVGLDLQNSGEFLYHVTKQVAVGVPLGITAACLLMMFLSKKTLYPWLVCLFSMAVPVIIMIINIFPA